MPAQHKSPLKSACCANCTRSSNFEHKKEDIQNQAKAFNADIRLWNVSHVVSAVATFQGATGFSQDLAGWSVGALKSMENNMIKAKRVSPTATSRISRFGIDDSDSPLVSGGSTGERRITSPLALRTRQK